MHIPDGFLSAPVWLTLDVLAIPAVGWAVRRAHPEPQISPMLGVMGAFVFAAQMVNVPVGLGASGHLLGSSLLAVVLGPAPAALIITAVLILQALLLQDGGVLALGANVCNMAFAGVAMGCLPTRLWGRHPLPLFFGGMLSVLAVAALVLWQLSLSGVALAGPPLWIAATLFTITAILEGAITVAAVRAIERLTPHVLPTPRPHRAQAALVVATFLLMSAGAWFSSAAPDALEQLAANIGLQSAR